MYVMHGRSTHFALNSFIHKCNVGGWIVAEARRMREEKKFHVETSGQKEGLPDVLANQNYIRTNILGFIFGLTWADFLPKHT